MNVESIFRVPKSTATRNVFISYRADDAKSEAARLSDALRSRFDDRYIFHDIKKIEPGLDFSEVISSYLRSCDVMLVVMGKNWIGADPASGRVRIQAPEDWVRIEVGTALRKNIRVIPVLMDGATLPLPEQLPPDLAPLLLRQTFDIRHKKWEADTTELLDFLEKGVGIPAKKKGPDPGIPWKGGWLKRNWLWVAVVSALVGFIWILLESLALLFPAEYTTKPVNPPATTTGTASTTGGPVHNPDPVVKPVPPIAIGGTWVEEHDGTQYQISQDQGTFTIQAYSDGVLIGSGSGAVREQLVTFDLTLDLAYLTGTVSCQLTLSADGKRMSGTGVMKETGVTSPFSFARLN
ncbi:toll/interleukin-1 receptor domain-containing protein [Rufibacter psychrotolerans]|uniref:toll/interleukin-1 receptor domain-containing protein n=1 Tax=Rufibacter psychrotolerans TaxID=2812556 RepID=UPI001966E051|nr:toll/interleukin-1 receptor domain-containing protein [Rufibacter sp. SYSU D00308]